MSINSMERDGRTRSDARPPCGRRLTGHLDHFSRVVAAERKHVASTIPGVADCEVHRGFRVSNHSKQTARFEITHY
jgi:hypothetical protein